MATLSRRPKPREVLIAHGVLLALAITLGWLLVRQARFSPAVTVATAIAARVANESARAPVAAATPVVLLERWPDNLKPVSAAEAFSAATLSDKIDGKAELYLPAGFVGLRCQRFAPVTPGAAWLEAFVYDMGKPDQAFSVYTSQKRTAHEPADIGDQGYRAANQLCFVHGRFYVEVVAAEENASVSRAAEEFGRAFVSATPVAGRATAARDEALFPAEGQIANSVMLLSADVFGFDQLRNVFVARYREGTGTVTLYFARRADAGDATAIAAALRGFLINDCGGREVDPAAGGAHAAVIDTGAGFDAVFATGRFLAGVHEAPTREAAAQWAERIHDAVTAAPP